MLFSDFFVCVDAIPSAVRMSGEGYHFCCRALGRIYTHDSMRSYCVCGIGWLQWTSLFRYGLEIMAINEFQVWRGGNGVGCMWCSSAYH